MIDTKGITENVDTLVFTDKPIGLNPDGTIKEYDDSSVKLDTPKVEDKPKNNSEIAELANEFYDIVETINALNDKKKVLGERIIDLIGTGVTIEFRNTGITLITVEAGTQNRFDTVRFKKDDPETYKQYIKEISVRPYAKVKKN